MKVEFKPFCELLRRSKHDGCWFFFPPCQCDCFIMQRLFKLVLLINLLPEAFRPCLVATTFSFYKVGL